MIFPSEYDALKHLNAQVSGECPVGDIGHEVAQKLVANKMISVVYKLGSSVPELRLEALGRDALALYEQTQCRQQQMQAEQDRLKSKARTESLLTAFYRVLTLLAFGISVLANWDKIASFFSSIFH